MLEMPPFAGVMWTWLRETDDLLVFPISANDICMHAHTHQYTEAHIGSIITINTEMHADTPAGCVKAENKNAP